MTAGGLGSTRVEGADMSALTGSELVRAVTAHRRRAPRSRRTPTDGLRFAFYGRMSTSDFQDPVTSRAWQREVAATLIAGHGTITAEFFDVGCSRRVAWSGGRGRRC